jgi:positive regulator of sigma E activity
VRPFDLGIYPRQGWAWAAGLTPRTKLILALPIIAAFVIALVYFQLFSSPVIIAIIFVAWLAVSLWNRRKFAKQKARKGDREGTRFFSG